MAGRVPRPHPLRPGHQAGLPDVPQRRAVRCRPGQPENHAAAHPPVGRWQADADVHDEPGPGRREGDRDDRRDPDLQHGQVRREHGTGQLRPAPAGQEPGTGRDHRVQPGRLRLMAVDHIWHGSFEPYVVGAPGRAAGLTVPLPDAEHWDRRDTVADGFAIVDNRVRRGDVRAASTRGLAHRHYGRVRQDEYGYRRTLDGRYLVMCVADGVSSGKLSHHAATVAAHAGVDLLVDWLGRGPGLVT